MGLQEWWFASFSPEDREWMANTYSPLGIAASSDGAAVTTVRRPLIEGSSGCTPQRASHHLGLLATWFSKPGHEHCSVAFAQKSAELAAAGMSILEQHFAYANQCISFYRWRDTVPGALESAIGACEAAIAIHKQAAVEAKEAFGIVPAHTCFRQLRIIEEKRGNYQRAIELCQEAKGAGWADDWDHQITRLHKKAAKADRT